MCNHIHDTTNLDKVVAYVIYRTSRILRFRLVKFFQEQGINISPEQWFILVRLFQQAGQSQGELADRDLNDHPNITRLLDALERAELIERRSDPNDRRRTLVYLSAQGTRMMEQLLPLVFEERKRLFDGFSNTEIATLIQMLNRIEHNALHI
ncbi:MAG: MarR family transcriptional regulator [Chloroflexaceae bacterium]|nr:MarR family transcriptional regulator [Chloroflexaceae bacterium]NJO07818.1 MarR family transcriptional regulator [Chloroflexaceae bacterium]